MLSFILIYLWQLPLNLLGLLYRDILTYQDKCQLINYIEDCLIYMKDSSGNIALGKYIFVSNNFTSDTIKELLEQSTQSKYLGPLYLIKVIVSKVLIKC